MEVDGKRKPHLKKAPGKMQDAPAAWRTTEGELPPEALQAVNKALEHCRAALVCKPADNSKALYRMGQAYMIKGDYIEALECLRRANGVCAEGQGVDGSGRDRAR